MEPLETFCWSTHCISSRPTVNCLVLMPFTALFDYVVPIDSTKGIKMLYVFVDIKLDATHFVDMVRHNFGPGTSLVLVSTIQFVATIQVCEFIFCFLCLLSYWVPQ